MQKKILIIFVFLFLFFVLSREVKAQVLSLSPATNQVPVGTDFAVDIYIDTAGKAAAGADVKLTFNPDVLEVVSVEKGTFFSDSANNISDGTLYVAGFFPSQTETKTGQGKVATVTFKGMMAGISTLEFLCSSQTTDSNILDNSSNDIINCAGMTNGTYTITSSGVSPTATPSAAAVGGGGETPVPTEAPPVSGTSFPTYFSLVIGVGLMVLGVLLAL